jgi:hypothetical protein
MWLTAPLCLRNNMLMSLWVQTCRLSDLQVSCFVLCSIRELCIGESFHHQICRFCILWVSCSAVCTVMGGSTCGLHWYKHAINLWWIWNKVCVYSCALSLPSKYHIDLCSSHCVLPHLLHSLHRLCSWWVNVKVNVDCGIIWIFTQNFFEGIENIMKSLSHYNWYTHMAKPCQGSHQHLAHWKKLFKNYA